MENGAEAARLGAAAHAVADAGIKAVAWIADAENQVVIGDLRSTIDREIRKAVVQARRLVHASERPMAVAVFGASQVGKSHLVSVLARKGETLLTRFEGIDEPVKYIERINPDTGKEATGLVSRFTVRPLAGGAAPAGLPVSLRLLSHADVIKIIANSYFFDGNPETYETTPDAKAIDEHLVPFLQPSGPEGRMGLSVEDIWDIAEYFQNFLAGSELTKRLGDFWEVAANVAPRLPLDQLGDFFSILWGRHEALTNLYTLLIDGLSRLDFASDAFVPFDAIDAGNRETKSILDVEALRLLGEPDVPMLAIATARGSVIQLSRPVVSAITAELRLRLAEKPWDFFESTDLLDFPGYRGRGLPGSNTEDEAAPRGLAGHLLTNRAGTIQEMLLRGKVEYLFQRYVAEQEITAMLLCAKESNLDVKKLPDVIANWVSTTHGAEAKARSNKAPLLFFVFTRFDMHFEQKESDRAIGLDQRFEGRMKASLIDAFGNGPDTWVNKWTPGEPFSNCFLMRNPNIKNRAIFAFDDQRETQILPERVEFIAALRDAFMSVASVKRHFVDPGHAFDAMMTLNDGGSTHIATRLAAVCDPDVKLNQIRDRLRVVRDRMALSLARFHIATDVEKRLAERTAVADEILDDLYNCESIGRFGSLIKGLTIDSGTVADRFYHALTWQDRGTASIATPPVSVQRPRPGAAMRPRPGQAVASNAAEAPQPAPVHRREAVLAETAQKCWLEHMYKRADNAFFCQEMGISSQSLREIVSEMAAAAHRIRLGGMLTDALGAYAHEERRDDLISKATVLTERLINGFVCDLGWGHVALEQRPRVPIEGGDARPIFLPRAVAYRADGLPSQPVPYRQNYFDDWTFGFYQTVQDNARSGDDGYINVVQNKRLGSILEAIDASLEIER